MSKEYPTIERDVTYLDHKTGRLVVARPRITDTDRCRVEVPAFRDENGDVPATSRDGDELFDAIESGQLEHVARENIAEYADATELAYFAERDEFDVDSDQKTVETLEYEAVVRELSAFDGVTAVVEREKSFSPNLRVEADGAGGQATSVFNKLADRFEAPDDFLAVAPAADGGSITYRVKLGGRA